MPPSALAASYRRLLAFEKTALLRVVKLGERARAGDSAGVLTVKSQIEGGNLRLLTLTVHTGLRDCSAIG